jgi:HTH-type transcriptional regulator/antitoxin HigA
MIDESSFNPDWVSPPGDTICDLLGERSWSRAEFAERLRLEFDTAEGLIQGRIPISQDIATTLEKLFGASAEFWMTREREYRASVVGYSDMPQYDRPEDWLADVPLADMRQYGWLQQNDLNEDPVGTCLKFFGVPDIRSWWSRYRYAIERTAFRTSRAFKARPGATAAWLRQGEIEADSIDCAPWSSEAFRETLPHIRSLSRTRDPKSFLPELTRMCAQSGVAIAIVRSPSGCRASGATRFTSTNKALLLLSFRYLSDDHFWFTFFHEAGHLLLHSQMLTFLEDGSQSSSEEDEANRFSESTLIPEPHQQDLRRLPLERHAIRNFAKTLGISPGLIVGQLQHMGRLRHNQLNNIKVRYDWEQR